MLGNSLGKNNQGNSGATTVVDTQSGYNYAKLNQNSYDHVIVSGFFLCYETVDALFVCSCIIIMQFAYLICNLSVQVINNIGLQ